MHAESFGAPSGLRFHWMVKPRSPARRLAGGAAQVSRTGLM